MVAGEQARIRPRPLPRLRPMLPEPSAVAFDSDDFLFELCWDGLRAIVSWDGEHIRIRGRNQADLTRRFPELQALGRQIDRPNVILDGHIVALDDDARPDGRLLAPRLLPRPLQSPDVCFQATDLLYLDGRPLLSRPLIERKRLLKRALAPSETGAAIEFEEIEGIAYYEAARKHRLPGVMAKRITSSYYPGRRSADWREIRVYPRDEFLVAGFVRGSEAAPLAALLLAVPEGRAVSYAGQVHGEFEPAEGRAIVHALEDLEVDACPFPAAPLVTGPVAWCRPRLVVEVQHGGWSPAATLRFPRFIALRPDASPRDCTPAFARAS